MDKAAGEAIGGNEFGNKSHDRMAVRGRGWNREVARTEIAIGLLAKKRQRMRYTHGPKTVDWQDYQRLASAAVSQSSRSGSR